METKRKTKPIPPEVRSSKFGCRNCLWAGIECKAGSMYKPAPDYYGNGGQAFKTCAAYTYYD